MIGAMRICRMGIDFYVCGVVIQEVEDVMAFMFVGTNNFSVHRNMVGNKAIGGNAFF